MVGIYAKQFDKKAVEEAFTFSTFRPWRRLPLAQVDGRRNRWVLLDDGGSRANARFDVFDSTGAYLGAVPVPREFGDSWRTVWGVDRVATIGEDADGLPVVVVYGIEKP